MVGLKQIVVLSCLSLLLSATALAAYPDRAIRVVLPYPAGGPTDSIGRVVTEAMANYLKQPVVMESKAGAGGTIGTAEVARSQNDGYTLLMNASVQVVYSDIYDSLNFDPIGGFEPIGLLGTVPLIAVVPASSGVSSMQELVRRGKSDKLFFASPGTGSFPHLIGEQLKTATGAMMEHVPYNGSAPAMTDVAGGHVGLMFAPLPTALPFIQSGRVRALAITTKKRASSLPDVPTLQEEGIAGLDAVTWYGLFAPAGTPKTVIETLNAALQYALRSPKVATTLEQQGATAEPMTVAQFKVFFESERRRWHSVVKAAGVEPL